MKWLSCPTLCDPMDCSLPCSSIHGVFQARVLEWVAISFSIYQRYHLKERLTWELFLGRQGNLHESMVHDSQLSNSGSEAETFTGEKNWYFCLQGQGNLTWKSYLRNFPGGSDGKASAYNAGDLGSIPGLGRSSGEGNGNPRQYSCLESPMGRGPW